MAVIGKTELAAKISEGTNLNKSQAASALDATLDAIASALGSGNEVRLTGFGTFRVTETKARTGRNPRTGDPLKIEAAKVPKFRAGKALKDELN